MDTKIFGFDLNLQSAIAGLLTGVVLMALL
jgi:hypothetical protein